MNGMTEEETLAFLSENASGVLCLNGDGGFPYGVPVNYVLVDGKIHFHGSQSGGKAEAISRDSRCCFTVAEDGGFEVTGERACNITAVYRSAIGRGNAVLREDEETKAKVLRRLVDVLVPERKGVPMDVSRVRTTAVYRIDPVAVTGKRRRPMPGDRVLKG